MRRHAHYNLANLANLVNRANPAHLLLILQILLKRFLTTIIIHAIIKA